MEFLIFIAIYGFGAFVLASFTGGFASAIAAGGREDHSLLLNAGIGFVGWLAASSTWALATGSWPDVLSAGLLALTFLFAILIAWRVDRRERARAEVRLESHRL